jgi:hypothetical protein
MNQSELILVDQDGVPRIIMTAGRTGSSILIRGSDRASLSISAAGKQCTLEMLKEGGRTAVSIASCEQGVIMHIADSLGRSRLTVETEVHDLNTTITFRNESAEAVKVIRFP